MSDFLNSVIEMASECSDRCEEVARLAAALAIGISDIPGRAKADFDQIHAELASSMKEELTTAVREMLHRRSDELRRVHGCAARPTVS